MAIPNTTPTPNELYNGEMKKMKDTELRVVLVVTRQTLGWIRDDDTGRRKEKDWISHQQLIDKTGRSGRAVSNAIESCVKNDWIEARNEDGKILDSPEKRSGNKIYYRLGEIFLEKTINKETSEESSEDDETSEDFSKTSEDSTTEDSSGYKKNSITKETITKDRSNDQTSPPKRNNVKYKKEDYNRILDAYQDIKGIELNGPDYSPRQQDIKTMFMADRTPEQIISFMRWLEESNKEWTQNWTLGTIKKKLPEFIAGKLKGRKPKTWEF